MNCNRTRDGVFGILGWDLQRFKQLGSVPCHDKPFERAKQMAHRASETIELPDYDGIEAASVRVCHQAIKFRTLLLRARYPDDR
jgi:hypothetical protein